jgi:hypothetical protein|tara:strand:+ start:361 stop:693 length:333 start_codon:yes stop_codon:yes gene_type:complete
MHEHAMAARHAYTITRLVQEREHNAPAWLDDASGSSTDWSPPPPPLVSALLLRPLVSTSSIRILRGRRGGGGAKVQKSSLPSSAPTRECFLYGRGMAAAGVEYGQEYESV